MKKLMILLAMSLPAHAEKFYWASNESGGALVLTTKPDNCITGKKAMLLTATGDVFLTACWDLKKDQVRVMYSDGDVKMYPPRIFRIHESKVDEVSL